MEILKFSEPPKRSGRSRSSNKSGLMPLVSFGIAVMVLGGMSTTLAGTITLNSSGNVEFGQGIVTTAACDTSVKVTPSTTFDTSTSTFKVNQIVFSGIGIAATDTRSATQVASGCLGKIFTVRAYNSVGTALDFTPTTGSVSPFVSFTLMADTATALTAGANPTNTTTGFASTKSGYWLERTDTAPIGSGTNTGVITISTFTLPATVEKDSGLALF
jgi:hypothetical protein